MYISSVCGHIKVLLNISGHCQLFVSRHVPVSLSRHLAHKKEHCDNGQCVKSDFIFSDVISPLARDFISLMV